MSPIIRIESFPEDNGPQISGVITRYTGMFGVDELLAKLPVEFEVDADNFEGLKSQLDQLGCNQKFVSLDELVQERLSPEDRTIVALARGKIIRRSLQLYWQNFRLFLEFSSILWLPTMVGYSVPPDSLAYVLLIWITFFLLSQLAYEHLLLASSERLLGRQVRFVDTWGRLSVSDFIKFSWTTILTGLTITLGFLLLVIPGIIWSIYFAVTGPVAVIEGKTGRDALRRSSQLATHGALIFGTLFCMGLLIRIATELIVLVFVFIGLRWGAHQEILAGYAQLMAYSVTTPLMAITMTTLYYHMRGLELKERVLREVRGQAMESGEDRICEVPGGVEYGTRCPMCNSEYFTSTTEGIYRCDECSARFK